MTISRRHLLQMAPSAMLTMQHPARDEQSASAAPPSPRPQGGTPDHTLRIATGLVELAPDAAVSTKLYNGQFPGPLLRLTEGQRVVVDVYNDTDTPELVHWHGQTLAGDVDGAAEEGTPLIPARGMRRLAFTPGPAGMRFYHTHVPAGADLSAGLYTGQAGLTYIEPRHDDGAYDQEIFLTLKEFGPFLRRMEGGLDFLSPTTRVPELATAAQTAMTAAMNEGRHPGYDVGYNFFSINGRMLGQGEPIRVKPGQRLLLHVVNASATEIRSLALPGHAFKVIALDGNPVPRPSEVPVLWLGPAERISCTVDMSSPGVWVMGDLADEARTWGMGVVVQYDNQTAAPRWETPEPFRWNYLAFAHSPGAEGPAGSPPRAPAETIEMTFGSRPGAGPHGFDAFTINGQSFSMERMEPRFRLVHGRRYRLRMRNATDDVHPIHLHRHTFEVTSIAGQPAAGLLKDVVMIGRYQEMTVDFTADQLGLSLFHCHMQHHMDFGFMAVFDCRRA